jgi:hypothetical protein
VGRPCSGTDAGPGLSCTPIEAIGGIGSKCCQLGVESKQSRTIRTEGCIRDARVDVDMGMIVRRGYTDAMKFSRPNTNLWKSIVIDELRITSGRGCVLDHRYARQSK